ncbi:serine/threonine-protein kinase PkaB-like isoform X2 [Paramacrobiotus metropolitanus]|uniref:serine/threonine-protein kinase PkaB-like isoform X2 n=1 Tax=Paramacrobiotus metropolitanus TaxID=2943436 RepID=UPI0024464680|nr:serine/threonine-protein kinase PkaB-like isoform X2 [Paramacrobiotus metropolitanus]
MLAVNDGNLQTKLQRMKDSGIHLHCREAVGHALDLADGLAFLHQNNIVHGDLKPENVLIDRSSAHGQLQQENLRISDLDHLVTLQRSTVSALGGEHFRGSERYMSPEMLRAIGPPVSRHTWPVLPGCATDMWSVGCILLQLVRCMTGDYREILHHPVSGQVRGAGATETLKDLAFSTAVMSGYIPVVLVSDAACTAVPPELAACIGDCLRTAGDQRITAQQLCDRLSHIN